MGSYTAKEIKDLVEVGTMLDLNQSVYLRDSKGHAQNYRMNVEVDRIADVGRSVRMYIKGCTDSQYVTPSQVAEVRNTNSFDSIEKSIQRHRKLIVDQEKIIATLRAKQEFLKITNSKNFKEKEFKAWRILQISSDESLDGIDKIKNIASLL